MADKLSREHVKRLRQPGMSIDALGSPEAYSEEAALTHLVLARDGLNRAWRAIQKGNAGRLAITDIHAARRNLGYFLEEYQKANPDLVAELDEDDERWA